MTGMGEFIELTAADGHKLSAWRAEPQGKPRAGVVVIQEIFGVNGHIRDVTERFAAQGYVAVAPALFDRVERGFESGYGPEDMARARAVVGKMGWDTALLDVEAARHAALACGRVGIVGFCYGGSIAWLGACRQKFDAAVCYYGGQILQFKDEKPHCPVMMHFGKQDAHISQETVEAIRTAQPHVAIHLYDAGHGFSCDQRASFDPVSHELAWQRTLSFFAEKLG
jgi:carboxymethylenebutenolidase